MILSGRDLRLYMETGKLKITPIWPEQFQQNGIDLILESAEWQPSSLSMGMAPGMFWLGATREFLILPDDLMAFVCLRSTWARRGFFLPPTIVDAGFQGNLTLEILRTSKFDMPIGERFAHLIFARTSGPCLPYQGKYLGQSGITKAKED